MSSANFYNKGKNIVGIFYRGIERVMLRQRRRKLSLYAFRSRYGALNHTKDGIMKKIIFHGFFYSAFTAGIFFLFRKYNIGILSSLIYGLILLLVFILGKLYLAGYTNIPYIDDKIDVLLRRLNNERQ